MSRVTQPGGTVAAAVRDYGQEMEMLRVFWDEAVALNREADARDERHMRLSANGAQTALFREQPLQEIASEALTAETRFSSFDDSWLPFLEKQGPAGAYAAAFRRPIVLRARAWAVRGTVPR